MGESMDNVTAQELVPFRASARQFEKVVIAVCTARRPKMLGACLATLARQSVPDGFSVTVAVIDNEPEPNNQAAIEDFAMTCPFAVQIGRAHV